MCKAEWNRFEVEIVENGVSVKYSQPDGSGLLGKIWVFQTLKAAFDFINEAQFKKISEEATL